ncbi:Cell surface mannoprotein mp65 [Exophiala xenobiotica]|uniref:Cell surface mannoprotein mp65 n=1 Tax=Lithohypha guttulata TaxID=1690604 RepID=A0ABR0K3B8_9EURO|nr:Cell surface mannoprotein mp65 [Lithohypha guttulata]KAK5326107.1 Cell surface mannoprotein mp65 [Exophiala xenobiotica]
MKITAYLAVAAVAQAATVPRHQRLHADRRDVAPVVETVTETLYQTVVWVDSNGKPVSTETKDLSTSPSATTPISVAASPTNYKKQPVNDSGTIKSSQSSSEMPSPLSTSVPPTEASRMSTQDAPQSTNDAASSQNTGKGQTAGNSASSDGMGICYDMIDSQPQCKDPATISSEFSFLKSQGYTMVRIYDIGCPVNDFTAAAAQHGLTSMVGINSIANLQGDLNKLIGMMGGNWASVDTVYIGNEQVNTGQASADQVAAAVSTAKGILSGAGFGANVITVDTFNVMMNDPTICSTSDYCGTNIHAFFDPNTNAPNAGAFVLNAYNKVAATNGGKRIVITETGWPYHGNANGQAVPSPENQNSALDSIRGSGVPTGSLYFFQAYNTGYKQPGYLGVEQYFGIYDH